MRTCIITKYNAYHKQSSTSSTYYTQYSSDLISKSISLPACLHSSIPAQELMRMVYQTHFSPAKNHSHYVGCEHMLQILVLANSLAYSIPLIVQIIMHNYTHNWYQSDPLTPVPAELNMHWHATKLTDVFYSCIMS